MTATLDGVTNKRKDKPEPTAEQKVAEELVARAREQGLSLTGPDGLLKQLTKTVLETALNQELTEHLGHDKHGPAGNETGNVRNGTRPKTVLTEGSGQVGIEVPRDRVGTFEPQIVRKRQRRLTGVDEMVLSLYAKGLTTGEISAHFAEIYGASVSKETISRITDKVLEEMTDWCNRPLDEIYAAIFVDAVMVKVRDGQVANRPIYAAIGVTLAGEKDILGLWAGTGGEGAKFWMSVLTDLKQPRHPGCVLPGLRRAQGPARSRRQRLAAGHRPDLHRPPDPQHLPARLQTRLGPAAPRRQTHLHRRQRRRGPGRARRADRKMGAAVSGDHPAVAQRLGTVHPVPGLRHRDPPRAVQHQCHRVAQRPLPAGGQGPRPFPDRAGGAKVPLPGHPLPRPDRAGQNPMGHEVEARAERVCHHLRRPVPGRRDLLTQPPETPLAPVFTLGCPAGSLHRSLPLVAIVSSAARRMPRTSRRGLRGAWHRP